jgi:hypothetical protein
MLKWLQIFLMFISVLLMRPSLLAEEFSIVTIPVLLLALLVKVIFRNKESTVSFDRSHIIILVAFLLIWIYLLANSVLNNAYNVEFTIKAFILHTVIVTIFSFLLSEKEVNTSFFKCVVFILSFFGISSLISVLLIETSSLNILMGTVLDFEILFPFSVQYGVYTIPNFHIFHRFMAFFREPGIAQAFYAWAIVYCIYFRFHRFIFFGVISGLILTLSTIGILSVFIVFFLLYLFKKNQSLVSKIYRSFISFFLIIGIYGVLYYMPFIGIHDKSNTHGISLDDRSDNISYAIENLNFFGDGMYSSNEQHSGINLISMSDEIGLFALILIIVLYFSPLLVKKQDNVYYFISFVPIALTSILAQPLLDAPLVYLFLFVTFQRS